MRLEHFWGLNQTLISKSDLHSICIAIHYFIFKQNAFAFGHPTTVLSKVYATDFSCARQRRPIFIRPQTEETSAYDDNVTLTTTLQYRLYTHGESSISRNCGLR